MAPAQQDGRSTCASRSTGLATGRARVVSVRVPLLARGDPPAIVRATNRRCRREERRPVPGPLHRPPGNPAPDCPQNCFFLATKGAILAGNPQPLTHL